MKNLAGPHFRKLVIRLIILVNQDFLVIKLCVRAQNNRYYKVSNTIIIVKAASREKNEQRTSEEEAVW